MSFLDPVLNPVLQPLLNMSPLWATIVLAFVITLVITLASKYFTNQTEMKRLKDEQKEFQKTMKGLRDKPDEMMKVQKEAMKANMQYMKHSFKVTLITFIPIILIFGWMNAHLAYEPIYPDEVYSISAVFNPDLSGSETELILSEGTELASNVNTGTLTTAKQKIVEGQASWYLKSTAGEHQLVVKVNEVEKPKDVFITTELLTAEPVAEFEDSPITQIVVNYKKLRPMGGFSIFGWEPGWLGIYIIVSIILSLGLRKLLNIY